LVVLNKLSRCRLYLCMKRHVHILKSLVIGTGLEEGANPIMALGGFSVACVSVRDVAGVP